jgi:UDP-2,3-diacylglucosamine hydrolase
VTAVLGTRLQPLPVAPGHSDDALLISDLHVPADGGPVLDRLQIWLDAAAERRCRLFVLGDLFDSFVSPRQLGVGVWREVCARLQRSTARGVSITVLHGNRDFLLGRGFAARSGVRVVAGGVLTTLAGRSAILLHGDELCQNDLPYQRAKRWLRSPLVRGLSHCLPLRTALNIAERARRRSRTVIASGDPTRFDPTSAAVAAAFASGAELLVFGHIHRAARGRIDGREYCVLPAFDDGGVGLTASDSSLNYAAPGPGGAGLVALPDPPVRSFAASR